MNAVSGLLTTAQPVLASGGSLDKTKPGLVAFLIVLALGVALWALLKNMGKQLGRAKDHFEAEDAALAAQAAAVSATTTVGTAEAVAEVPKQQDGPKGAAEKATDGSKDAAGE
ncbi:hypothetical protein [Catenulispora rubra]|uniref:hypothetical protein n=1 Tax=Catenulispora rubra TaxID=280293 RepID=UPI0018924410|nr:hypothetical protein [Catenulispora rubra]